MDTAARVGNFCGVCGRPVTAGVVCNHGGFNSPPPPSSNSPAPALKSRRSIMQILLDPRSIQWLLASGGGLLVSGLVIWLASLGIFENPLVVAASLGIGTTLMLGSGWWVIRGTRFQLAGRAITLLACLVMPLNLWFYHSHSLLTLDGNLWMAAVVCCALYAASALVLRDPLFVYVLCAGVAGTGLLILADMHKFAEIAAPSLMLVAMGLVAIHAERAFAPDQSPFSRQRFGKAFFFSGHALLGGGLLLLLGAQITGWFISPMFESWNLTVPVIVTDPTLRLLAIGMVAAGTYAYVYSDVVVRKVGAYIYPAAATLLWAELLLLQMLNLEYGAEIILATVSATALLLNVLHAFLKDKGRVPRTITPLAMLLSMAPVAFGVLMHLRATHSMFYSMWSYHVGWSFVGAMATTAVACRIGAFLHRKTNSVLCGAYFFLTATASVVGAAGLLSLMGITAWASQASILMLIPIAYLVASRFYRDGVERESLVVVAQAVTLAMVVSVLASATHLAPRVFQAAQGMPLNLLLAIFFAEGAIFYAILAGIRKQAFHVFVATAMAGAAMWQMMGYFHAGAETYMVVFAGSGLILIVASRVLGGVTGRSIQSAGHALMTLSFLSSALMVASRMLVSRAHWDNASLLGLMMLMTFAAAIVVGATPWRRTYGIMTVINGMIAFMLLAVLSDLSGWQKAEIFSVVGGLALLVAGHVSWLRDQDGKNEMVGFCLFNGAMLAGVPLLIAVIAHRFGGQLSVPDEIALLTIGSLMLISGLIFQLQSTTITGGGLLALHMAVLLGFAGWKAQLALGVYLSIGGAVVFLAGLGLAIYRERLLQLPEKFQRREGVFKVLAWR